MVAENELCILLDLAVYAAATSLMGRPIKAGRLLFSGRVRALPLASTLATGLVMVAKNLSAVHLPMPALIAFSLVHMGAAVLFMVGVLTALVFRRPWPQPR